MSVDDAFRNLIKKRRLAIPFAGPDEEESPSEVSAAGEAGVRGKSGEGKVKSMTIPQSLLIDDAGPDYDPPESSGERGQSTETDLAPASPPEREESLLAARRLGAGIAGRDSSRLAAAKETRPADREEAVPGKPEEAMIRARVVRRFSYLPASGIEAFNLAVREMATGILSSGPDRPSLMITSSGRKTGKTELALRTALALAKKPEFKVLLADFDLKRPHLAGRLGITVRNFSAADVLGGSCALEDALIRSEEDNLFLLPARPYERESDGVLNGKQAAALLDRIHGTFDFAVFDCGPVPDGGAALCLCRHVGGVVLAAYCGRTGRAEVAAAAEALAAMGVVTAGVLLAGSSGE